jgi:hypothetical protein
MVPGIPMETWTVVRDSKHNAFTDLLFWHDEFWLAYISSPSHFASKHSRVIILHSDDARSWREAAAFSGNGEDIRDPKLAVIGNQIFLYALLNKQFDPEPYRTVSFRSMDGASWSAMEDVMPHGWLLGRPLSPDGAIFFAPAHHLDLGKVVLLRSRGGIAWDIHATIHDGNKADETAVMLARDGAMVSVTRIEAGGGIFGHREAGTQICKAFPPYTEWLSLNRSSITRLDGPTLFAHNDRIFAVGRRQVRVAGPFQWQGSAFGRKRSALFLVDEKNGEMIHLTDLPSSGDTSYPGAAIVKNKLLISYYTNDPKKDMNWLHGMLLPTQIQIVRIEISKLTEALK